MLAYCLHDFVMIADYGREPHKLDTETFQDYLAYQNIPSNNYQHSLPRRKNSLFNLCAPAAFSEMRYAGMNIMNITDTAWWR